MKLVISNLKVDNCSSCEIDCADGCFHLQLINFWPLMQSKKSKRRLRQPSTVPAAYAKVMKKLNFC